MKSSSFPPSFHLKKGIANFIIGVHLIYGFRQRGAFWHQVGVRLIRGCDLYSSIYGTDDKSLI